MLAPVAEAEFGERALLELGLRSAGDVRGLLRRARRGDRPRRGPAALGHARRGARRRRGRGARAADRLPRRRSASPSSACGPARRAGWSPRSRRRCGSRSTSPATTRSTRGGSSPRSRAAVEVRRGRAARVLVADGRVDRRGARGRRRAARRTPSCSRPARTARASACRSTRACRCAPSRARCCGCATPAAPDLVERTIRGEQAYLVPRGDGRYVLGATMEERGWDTAPTAGGVYELIRDMSEVVPGVLELEIDELQAGLRPAHARQPAGDRPRRARGPGVGHRPPPQRHPARRPSRPSWWRARWPASPLPGLGARRPIRRASRRCRHEGARQRRLDRAAPTARRSRPRSQALELPASGRGVAVAVDAEVVPARGVGRARAARGRAGRDPARDPGRLNDRYGHHRPTRCASATARSARGCCSARAASARSTCSPRRSRRARPSSSPSRCGGSTRPSAARSSTCSTAPASRCCPTPPAASRPATRC